MDVDVRIVEEDMAFAGVEVRGVGSGGGLFCAVGGEDDRDVVMMIMILDDHVCDGARMHADAQDDRPG